MNQTVEFVEKPGSEFCQEKHENIKLENLRKKHRQQKLLDRSLYREVLFNKCRFLEVDPGYKNFVESDITTLANSLKNKGQVSCELLSAVLNFLDNQENITAFLKVNGALQALLRLLSGQNEKFQLIAAKCICNLALGNEKQRTQVLKAAESYLIVHLSAKNKYLKEVCAVGLGNLSRQSSKNIGLLMSQSFLPKMIDLLSDGDAYVEAAAIYALTLFIYHGFDILKSEDLENCLLGILPLFRKGSFSVAFLLSLLSSCKDLHQQFISNGVHLEALKCLLISLEEKEKEAVNFLRIVSNLSVDMSVAGEFIEDHNFIVTKCINYLLQSEKDYLKKECLGWLGNLINHPVDIIKIFGVRIVTENIEVIKLYKKSCDDSSEKAVQQIKMDVL